MKPTESDLHCSHTGVWGHQLEHDQPPRNNSPKNNPDFPSHQMLLKLFISSTVNYQWEQSPWNCSWEHPVSPKLY